MKVTSIKKVKSQAPVAVVDCCVSEGFVKTSHGSMPDVDVDFDADRREEVRQYLERRYNQNGKRRVFSAGTFTTEKIKSVIKDVARTHKISQSTTNYLTAILDDKLTWTDLMRTASKDKRLKDFIQKHPDVFEEILPIMGQPRSASIHASAVIVVPSHIKGEMIDCFDVLPMRTTNNMLVSELSGAEIDAIGILKNDVLTLKELTRLSDILNLIEGETGKRYTLLEITSKYLNDPKVFDILKAGHTQGVFQLASDGIAKFVKRLKPDNIDDVIASVALYRPGPLQSGSTDNYIRAKRGEFEPEYLWGTYEILKYTYAEPIYQEQVSQIAQKVGGLSLGDGVELVKAVSKKKIGQVRKFQDKFFAGAKANGCPKEAAEKIWSNIENAASYLFNQSHASAYGLISYAGAWLKTYYPTAFYTVALRDQDEDKMAVLMNEIETTGGTILEKPNINVSGENFVADFKNNIIYWSLSRIKQLGPRAVKYIVQERDLYGEFYDMEDFIKRIFKSKFKSFEDDGTEQTRERCPVTARSVRNLIFAGAFDQCDHIDSILGRYGLLEKAAGLLGFNLTDKDVPEDMRDKHYFWSRQQIAVSGHGSIDYQMIYKGIEKPKSLSAYKFIEFRDLNSLFCDIKRGVICATVCNVMDKSYKDKRTGETKHFGKIELQQNTETNILTIWDDWVALKSQMRNAAGRMIVAVVTVKWSDYDEKNTLQIGKNVFLQLI